MPVRIQRKRSKGWRMPVNAIYVGRPTKWGNVFGTRHSRMTPADRYIAVQLYRAWVMGLLETGVGYPLRELRGKDLACWCPLDHPCHGDVLLELANALPSGGTRHRGAA